MPSSHARQPAPIERNGVTIPMELILAVMALIFALAAPPLEAAKTISGTKKTPSTPQAVCKFITERMNSAVPQVPNLCSGSVDPISGNYEITFTSSKEVLEGDLRRGWSSALFQSLEEVVSEPSLNGACGATSTCDFRISDSYLSRHNLDYLVPVSKRLISRQRNMAGAFNARELSDDWYILWWSTIIDAFKEPQGADHRSKENAGLLAEEACRQFIDSLSHHIPSQRLPECSVLASARSNVFVEIRFPRILDAVLDNNLEPLFLTFGRIFDATAYSGSVALRSQWEDTNGDRTRVNKVYDLSRLEISFEEVNSGSRDAAGAELAIISRFGSLGQTSERFLNPDSSENDLIIRNVALVRLSVGDSTVTLDSTDGAEWQATFESFSSCAFRPGDLFTISVVSGKDATLAGIGPLGSCMMKAKFVKGW